MGSSRIEQLIEEIENYLDSCKLQQFSKTNIIVNKEEIFELLDELKQKTPEEIRRYQKMLSQKEAILEDARKKANTLIQNATKQTNQLISEHEIMQQAYAQANEIVSVATKQAQQILDKATQEANEVREATMDYLEDKLAKLEELMTASLESTTLHYEKFYATLSGYNEIVKSNRAELHPVEELLDDNSGFQE